MIIEKFVRLANDDVVAKNESLYSWMDWALNSKNAIDKMKNSIVVIKFNSVIKLNEILGFGPVGRMPMNWHDFWNDWKNFIVSPTDDGNGYI